MGEPTAVQGKFTGEFTLNNFDLWAEQPKDGGWDLSGLRLDSYAMLSQMEYYDDGSDFDGMLPISGANVLYYEGYVKNDSSTRLPEVYQVARVFKRRQWGVVLLTFDGPYSPLEDKVSIGPDVGPLLEGDVKELFTEAVAVYLGPQLDKGPYADYGRILVPLRHPYIAPQNWESKYWAM